MIPFIPKTGGKDACLPQSGRQTKSDGFSFWARIFFSEASVIPEKWNAEGFPTAGNLSNLDSRFAEQENRTTRIPEK